MSAQPQPAFRLLADLPRNARNSMLLEPLWGVFGVVVLYYAPLYLRLVGLSTAEIGLLGSLTLGLSFLWQAAAAPITNRFGRRRTTLITDLVSWSLPMLLWAAAHAFVTFAAAASLNAVNRVTSVSWSLLVIEDVEAHQRPRIFGVLNMIIAFCGLLTPLVGLVATHYGTVPTLRTFYMLGAVGMTTMFLWRNAVTQETHLGQQAITEHRDLSVGESLRQTLRHVASMRGHPGLSGITVFYVLTVFTEQLNLFQILFLGETLQFSAQALSFVPFVAAPVTAVLYLLVLPRLHRLPPGQTLVLVRSLALLGATLLLLIPAGNVAVMLTVVGLIGGAGFLTQTYRDAALFSRLPAGGGAADLYSAVQTLTLLCSVPAAAFAGLLFASAPRSLFILIAALIALTLLLSLWLARREEPRAAAG